MDKIDEQGSGERRARYWQWAFEHWLKQREAAYSKEAAGKDRKAWDEFLSFAGKPPWRISPGDVQNYIQDLESRGRSAATIQMHLSSISKFYRFCQAQRVDPWLHRSGSRDFDPTRGVKRPERNRYGKFYCLNREEEQAFLEVISQDRSPMGLRDYAMFLCLLRTGLSAEKMRKLTYPLPPSKGEGKGAVHDALPDEVDRAIFTWLNSSGRLDGIQPGDYIFTPSKDPLHIEAKSNPEDWDAGRPVSKQVVSSLIQRYASKAGLRVEAVNAHTLRHTAVRRMIEAGWSREQIGRQLGIRAKSHLRPYLKGVATAGNPGFVKRPENRSEQKTISHAPPRWTPEDYPSAFKHGMYARGLLPEVAAMKASGALDGKSPHEIKVLNYEKAIERAYALVDDENVPSGQKPGIMEGVIKTLSRIFNIQTAAWRMEQIRRAQAEEREYKPQVSLGYKPSRSYQRSAYNPDNAYPKLSEREKQRRQDEANGRHTGSKRKPSSRRGKAENTPPAAARRTFRRPEPDEGPTYHVDFFNEGGEEEE